MVPGLLCEAPGSERGRILSSGTWDQQQLRQREIQCRLSVARGQNVAGEKYTALYTYEAQYEDELSFEAGDTVLVVAKDEADWWKGECQGKTGVFPSNYVEPLKCKSHLNQDHVFLPQSFCTIVLTSFKQMQRFFLIRLLSSRRRAGTARPCVYLRNTSRFRGFHCLDFLSLDRQLASDQSQFLTHNIIVIKKQFRKTEKSFDEVC